MTYEAFLDDVGCLDDVDKAWSPRARQAAAQKRRRGRPAAGAVVGGLVSEETKRKAATGGLAVGALAAVAASQVVSQRRAARRVAKSAEDDLGELDPEPFDKAWSPRARQAAADARRRGAKGKGRGKKKKRKRTQAERDERLARIAQGVSVAGTAAVLATPYLSSRVACRERVRSAGKVYSDAVFRGAEREGTRAAHAAHTEAKAQNPRHTKLLDDAIRRGYNERARKATMSRPDQLRAKVKAGRAERDFNRQVDAVSNRRRARRARSRAYTVGANVAVRKSVADDFELLDVPERVGKARKPKAAAQAARKKAAAAAGSPTPPKTAKKPDGPRPAALCLDHAVRSFTGRQKRREKLTRDDQKRAGKRQMRFNAHLEAAKSDSPQAQRRKAGSATLSKPKPKAAQPRKPRSRP